MRDMKILKNEISSFDRLLMSFMFLLSNSLHSNPVNLINPV
jgi:hypothetical protein